jgi:2-keto-4-pentenoate hydratase/2-oxohepta-3-ene-1,7-dioic acid hydratase in catechol pathway
VINYSDHNSLIEWANKRAGLNRKPSDKADVGYRSPNALIASGETIVIPADSPGPVQFEGELVAVIGKPARDLSEADALSCVLGYTLGNDLSERTWQKQDRTLWRAKNCDTFKPMGPFVVTGLDPMDLIVSVRVNGEKASESAYCAVRCDAPRPEPGRLELSRPLCTRVRHQPAGSHHQRVDPEYRRQSQRRSDRPE